MTFQLTAKQLAAQEVLSGISTYLMLFGGSRSGKTFLHLRNLILRALIAPGSRHAVLRFRFNHLRATIIADTFPKVMRLCFPDVEWHIDKTEWVCRFPNGSEIWFGGLDDKERTEKILGMEFATIYLNECSQISWDAAQTAITRLAQRVDKVIDGVKAGLLRLRMYFDCNPPSKVHWTYRIFIEKVDPETRRALVGDHDYAALQMNPIDNRQNLAECYLDALKKLSARLQKRFLKGEFADANPHALFRDEDIDKHRVIDGKLPEFVRVVVGVDPSGSGDEDNADNDEIGITVGALGTDGEAYLLEDCSVKVGPATWGRISTNAYERHEANVIVGEGNFGGAMVRHVIQTARPNTPFKLVHASRGKAVRAEPFSALYEQGRVHHVGEFQRLEDELVGMSTIGYTGQGSPNRADAWIWVLAELFPALTKAPEKKVEPRKPRPAKSPGAWMG